jgi:membrane-bound lytic murein transglycosylase D
VPLAVVARAAGATVEEIQRLNPQLRRGRTPPGATDYVVRIPEGRTALFAQRFPQLRGDWDGYEAYVVAHGERFEDVATKHGLSRQRLAALNEISHQSELGGGTILVVPVVSEEEKRRNLERARDDLYSAGVPRGEPGEKLIVAVPDKDLTVPGKRRVFYRVVIGDTLWGVSRAFRVDRALLAEWNGLDPEAHLHPRMVLVVFVDPDLDLDAAQIQVLDESRIELVERGSSAHLDGAERRMGRERFVYTPQTRETYADIGKKFGLTSRDIARINRLPYNTTVEPGEEVILYRVVDPSRSERARDQSRRARSPQPRNRPRR